MILRVLTFFIVVCGSVLRGEEFPLEKLFFSLMEKNDKVVVQYNVYDCIGGGESCTFVFEGAQPTRVCVSETTCSRQVPRIVLRDGPASADLLKRMDALVRYLRKPARRYTGAPGVELGFSWYSNGELLRAEKFTDGFEQRPPFSMWKYVLQLRAKLPIQKYRELLLSDDPYVHSWALHALDRRPNNSVINLREEFIKCASSPRPHSRSRALVLLHRSGYDPAALSQMVVRELGSRKVPDRPLIEVLGKLGSAAVDALPLLESYRDGADRMLQAELKKAIGRIAPYVHEGKARETK